MKYMNAIFIFLFLIANLFAIEKSKFQKEQVSSDPNQSAIPLYTLFIESEPDMVDISTPVQTHQTSDQVLILVDDNPIGFFSRGTKLMQINQYLKPGRNTLSLKGKHHCRLWFEITLSYRQDENKSFQQDSEKVVLDEMIDSHSEVYQWQKSFEAGISYTLPIFKEGNEIPAKDDRRKEVLKFLCELHDNYRNHDFPKLKQQNLSLIWQDMAYNRSEAEIKELTKAGIEFLKQTEYLPFDESSIKLEFGTNLVLAYTGFEGPLNSAYLWPVLWNNQELNSPPLVLAYIGKWVVWE